MHGTIRLMARESGVALAMLAVYVLTLLLPLHQAAGLQRELNALGFSTLDSWSVCQALAADETGDPLDAAALSCPVAGMAKQNFAAGLPPVLVIEAPAPAPLALRTAMDLAADPARPAHFGQSRAPPLSV